MEVVRLDAPKYSDVKELNFLAARSFTDYIYMCLFLVIIYMNSIYLIRNSSSNYGAIFRANGIA
jgi:hypothetical protein